MHWKLEQQPRRFTSRKRGPGGSVIGKCGFKGPPGTDGAVEIAYGVAPEHQGKGYATEAAAALVSYALSHAEVRIVRAHTLPGPNASTRVLTKCGFQRVGEVIDPEDGLVWRWEQTMKRPDHALQRTVAGRSGCKQCVPCAGSLEPGSLSLPST